MDLFCGIRGATTEAALDGTSACGRCARWGMIFGRGGGVVRGVKVGFPGEIVRFNRG